MQFQGMKKEIVSHLQLEPRMENTIVKFETRQPRMGLLINFILFILLFYFETVTYCEALAGLQLAM